MPQCTTWAVSSNDTAQFPVLLCVGTGLGLLTFDVIDRRIKLALELLDTVVDAMQVGAEADHLSGRR